MKRGEFVDTDVYMAASLIERASINSMDMDGPPQQGSDFRDLSLQRASRID